MPSNITFDSIGLSDAWASLETVYFKVEVRLLLSPTNF